MKKLLFLLVFSSGVFAYNDVFLLGGFGQTATLRSDDAKLQGFGVNLGYEMNANKEHSLKNRFLISVESRKFKSDKLNFTNTRLGLSYLFGTNLDLLTNDELDIFLKFGFGHESDFSKNKASDEVFGLMFAYATKYVELNAGFDFEFRKRGFHMLFPVSFAFDENKEISQNAYFGLNLRF